MRFSARLKPGSSLVRRLENVRHGAVTLHGVRFTRRQRDNFAVDDVPADAVLLLRHHSAVILEATGGTLQTVAIALPSESGMDETVDDAELLDLLGGDSPSDPGAPRRGRPPLRRS
jgi:hypothetical protein